MVDIKEKSEENPQTPPAAASAVGAAQPPLAPETLTPADIQKEKAAAKMSPGEKWYNRIVYQGINYWLNLAMSMYVSDIFTHGGGKSDFTFGRARNFYDRRLNQLTSGLTTLMGHKHQNAAYRASEVTVATFTLNTGGNILLIPMKWLEDRKRPVVHWLNKHIFKEKQLAPDGHEETPDEIYIEQEQPPQSWGRVIWRRIKAVSATIVTGLVADWALRRKLDANEPRIINGLGQPIDHEDGTKRFTRWITTGANKGLNYVSGSKKFVADDTALQRYMGYAALDTIYTGITSKVMHMTNGAGPGKMPKEIGDDFDPPVMAETDELKILPEAKNARPFAGREDKKADSAILPAGPAHKKILEKPPAFAVSDKVAARREGEPDYSLAP